MCYDADEQPDEIMDLARQSSLVEYSSKGKLEPVREVNDLSLFLDGSGSSPTDAVTLVPGVTTSTEAKADKATNENSTRHFLAPPTSEAKGNSKTELHAP